jgi:hypothetical protein
MHGRSCALRDSPLLLVHEPSVLCNLLRLGTTGSRTRHRAGREETCGAEELVALSHDMATAFRSSLSQQERTMS